MNTDADDRLDAQLRGFLAERAADTAGLPSAERIAARIAGGATVRFGQGSAVRPIWLAATIGLLVLLVMALVLVGGRQSDVLPGTSEAWVAYATEPGNAGGATQIYVVKPGLEPKRIAGDDAGNSRNTCPAFSPDGRMLAYGEGTDRVPGDSGGEPGTNFSNAFGARPSVSRGRAIVVLELSQTAQVIGSSVRIPVPGTGPVPCPRWSPDSTRLAYDPGFRIVVMGLDGTQTATAWRRDSTDLAWSPDGSTLAVTGRGGTWLVPADGGPPRWMSDGPSASVDWAPDGSRLVVDNWVNGSISIIDVDEPSSRVEVGPGRMPAWSPSGDWIAFLRECPDEGNGPAPLAAQLVVVRPDGFDSQVVAADCDNGLVGWSDDGRQVLQADRRSDLAWAVSASSPDDPGESVTLVTTMATGDRWVVPGQYDVSWQPVHR